MSEHKIDPSKNEQGKSLWPKYVNDKDGNRVVVNNAAHEAEVTGEAFKEPNKQKENTAATVPAGNDGWGDPK